MQIKTRFCDELLLNHAHFCDELLLNHARFCDELCLANIIGQAEREVWLFVESLLPVPGGAEDIEDRCVGFPA